MKALQLGPFLGMHPQVKKRQNFESHLCSWACCCQGSLLSLEIHSRWAQKLTLNSRSMSGVKKTTPSSPKKFSAISRGQTFHSLFKDQSGAHLVGCLAVKIIDSRSCESQLLYVSPTTGRTKYLLTLWQTNITLETGPSEDVFPIENMFLLKI